MRPAVRSFTKAATVALTLGAVSLASAAAPSGALAAAGFGPLSGEHGCLVAPGQKSSDRGTSACGVGKGLLGAHAVAVSPDGANVYVVGGVGGDDVAQSYGAVEILARDPATGALSEVGCLSSDGTDGRDGASGACAIEPSLLGASGVAVSPDGSTVFVASRSSASVVAFSRNPATGALTRLGCFQGTPRPGAPCVAANLLSSAGSLLTSADGTALYVAEPEAGAISTIDAADGVRTPAGIVPAAQAASPASTSAPSSGASGAGAPGGSSPAATAHPSLAAIFSPSLIGDELLNPCIAVNGLDGVCAVSAATQSLDSLALSPDGKELYAAAPKSQAIDVFAPGASGALAETGCVKVQPPPGLCSAGAHLLEPTALAISPDGTSVYAADHAPESPGGMVDVLTRDPTSGALVSSGCVEFEPKPVKPEPEEEEGPENEEEEHAPKGRKAAYASASSSDGCTSAPGLDNVSVVAVSGDGSAVYAIGNGVAAIFSRDAATGQLSETSCAADEDERCTSMPALSDVSGAAVSPDGHQVYVVASDSDAVMAFGIGAAVTSARATSSAAGIARVSVLCPRGLRRACRGSVQLTRAVRARSASRHGRRTRVVRLPAGGSGAFSIAPGRRATVRVRLTRGERRLLARRRRLGLMAVVRASPAAGGSGYGRRLTLRLG